jgi:ribosomal protein S18 acetylase RimI-like enzyme
MTPTIRLREGTLAKLREQPEPGDAEAVGEIVVATGFFTPAECEVARSLVRERLGDPKSSYRFVFATLDGRLAGYTCYGRIPATEQSFDLYWIAVHPRTQGRGLGAELLLETEREVAAQGGGQVWAETSGTERYAPTRAFYARAGYRRIAELPDFYAPGDDKVFFAKSIPAAAAR